MNKLSIIDTKYDDKILFDDVLLSSSELIEMMKKCGIPFDEDSIYQTDIEENMREFCCSLIKKLNVEIEY